MKRGLWFVAGAGTAVYVMVRGRRARRRSLSTDSERPPRRAPEVGGPGCSRDEVAQGSALRRNRSCARGSVSCLMGHPSSPGSPPGDPHHRHTDPGRQPTDGHQAEIRRRFVAHFESHGHTPVPSASPLLLDDPNLLFVNAGMVPFQAKNFLGQETAPYPRATSAPEVRADRRHRGRRQDHPAQHLLRDVWQLPSATTSREGAIELAWGSWSPGRPPTAVRPARGPALPERVRRRPEAVALWKKVTGLPDERIAAAGQEENYWSMGVPGPGGPCSEILIDRGPAYGPDFDPTALGPGHAARARGPAAGDLEPGLAGRALGGAVQVRLRHLGIAAEEEHRHRDGSRARGVPLPRARRTTTRSTCSSP